MARVLGGRYHLVDLVGGGGMGEVWSARDDVLQREVAVKIIRPHLADDEGVRARLRLEAQLAGSLHHPGIVEVFDYGEDVEDGRPVPFLVMALVDGAPLSAVLADRGTLSTGETMAVVEHVAAALQVAHDAGIVHRDLKLGNVLVTPDGRVLLLDFGIARAIDGESLTRTGTLIGTADYLSPEQASGGAVSFASDLYALGVVAHACLTGRLPFHRDTDVATAMAHLHDDVPPLPDEVPTEVDALVRSLLAKRAEERPASAAVVQAMASTFAASPPLPPGRVPEIDGDPTAPEPAPTAAGGGLPGVVERGVTVGGDSATSPIPAVGSEPPTEPSGAPTAPVESIPTADPAPTAVTPAAGAGEAAGTAADRPPRRARRAVLLAAVLLLVAAVVAAWLRLDGRGDVTVPDVVGRTEQQAVERLESAGLRVRVEQVDRAGAEAGEVVAQDPDAGSTAREGGVVTLSVASGKVAVPVDDLVGETYDDAVRVLDDLGLGAAAEYGTSSEPAGAVVDVRPTGAVDPGTTVTLVVSAGSATGGGVSSPTPKGPKEPKGKGNGNGNGNGGGDDRDDEDDAPEPEPSEPEPEETAAP